MNHAEEAERVGVLRTGLGQKGGLGVCCVYYKGRQLHPLILGNNLLGQEFFQLIWK